MAEGGPRLWRRESARQSAQDRAHAGYPAAPGVDLRISAKVSSSDPLRRVILHYRPVNQAVAWKEIDLRPTGDGLFEATIPASDITPAWEIMYYLEALVQGGGTLWPSWETGPPYVVVTPKREAQPGAPGRANYK